MAKHLGDYNVQQNHVKLEEFIDKKIYVHDVVRVESNTYGLGWKLYFTTKPGAKEVMNASTFSQTVVPVVNAIMEQSGGKNPFTKEEPLEVTIVRKGRSIFLE